MTNRKSSVGETRIYISKEAGENIKYSRVTLPSQIKSVNFKDQSRSKSFSVMALQPTKRNLKNVFTDTEKSLPSVIEKNIPKTKFSAQDKSDTYRSPSPRLKTFPAEKIKKIDGNTLLQSTMSSDEPIVTSHLEKNIGHGDALDSSKQIQITPRHQSENISKSQQNVSYFYQVGNDNQSDGVLPLRKNYTPVLQSHRPFVPNFSHGTTIQKSSPINQITVKPTSSLMPNADSVDISKQTEQNQNRFETKEKESTITEQNQGDELSQVDCKIPETDYQKQPVGGRVAALHRQTISGKKLNPIKTNVQSQIQQQTQFQIPQEPIQQQFHSISHNHALDSSNAQNEAQKQMQHKAMLYQQHMMNQMQLKAYYDHHTQWNQEINSVMTSPQDMYMNRERCHQTCPHHLQMPVNSSNINNPNVKAQLEPYAINLINPHSNQNQSTIPMWHQPLSTNDNILPNQSNLKPIQDSLQINQGMKIQENNQNNHQMMSMNQQQVKTLDSKQPMVKKVYHYTPAMIRDQEQLVATMQQQRIPENIMQRQFQLLLSEQNKQIAYLDQLAQGELEIDQRTSTIPKKNIRSIIDEKPDWMAHITPPRIPYCELEKRKNEHSFGHNLQVNQNLIQHKQSQIEQHQYPQVHHHQNSCQNQHQMYFRPDLDMTPPFSYQQYQNHHQYYPSQYQQYPQIQQQMPQYPQQTLSVPPNCNQQNNLEMISQQRKHNSKSVEPSSLLQLRLYKEIIQSQKRNNGLQDSDTVKEALEALKKPETKKGYEYLANLNKKEPIIKLNGVQEPGEIPNNLLNIPTENLQQVNKQISANGLENKRNPDNPLPPFKKIRQSNNEIVEYPRSKRQSKPQNCTYVPEKGNDSHNFNPHYQYPRHNYVYGQMPVENWSQIQNPGNIQQINNNRQFFEGNGQGDLLPGIMTIPKKEFINQPGGDQQNNKKSNQYGDVIVRSNGIQEPRIIGGVSYLARKPNSIPNAIISA